MPEQLQRRKRNKVEKSHLNIPSDRALLKRKLRECLQYSTEVAYTEDLTQKLLTLKAGIGYWAQCMCVGVFSIFFVFHGQLKADTNVNR